MTQLTFCLPTSEPPGEVSVVGSFNDWTPGRHILQAEPGQDTRQVSVIVEPGTHHFRYLASGGTWIDEADADDHTDAGSTVHCPASDDMEGSRETATTGGRTATATETSDTSQKK